MADWVCISCGVKYGSRSPENASFHNGHESDESDCCYVCGSKKSLTEPKNFGVIDLNTKLKFNGFKKINGSGEYHED